MELTGKAKKDFMNWIHQEQLLVLWSIVSKSDENSFQWGVIVDWADSVDVKISIKPLKVGHELLIQTPTNIVGGNYFATRQELRGKAVVQLNEIYNQKN